MWLLRLLKNAFMGLSAALKRAAEASCLLHMFSLAVASLVPLPVAVAAVMALGAKVDAPPLITAVIELGLLGLLLLAATYLPMLVVAAAMFGVSDLIIDLYDSYLYYRSLP